MLFQLYLIGILQNSTNLLLTFQVLGDAMVSIGHFPQGNFTVLVLAHRTFLETQGRNIVKQTLLLLIMMGNELSQSDAALSRIHSWQIQNNNNMGIIITVYISISMCAANTGSGPYWDCWLPPLKKFIMGLFEDWDDG